ncbi:MAG: SusC/RagA family TonB-linked outer membrane protein [Prevotellaceae bacterium]|jgi:TonB-linked SusC/RagA family outer membrane protein|nr:SusC/RagA family TonB-linked outer membrane protein [Prevotellaceae bacterium]
MKPLFVLLLGAALSVGGGGNLYAQAIALRGKVSDAKGEALPGVTVQVKNTSRATMTDLNGTYSIEVPAGQTVVFSYIGFVTHEQVVDEQIIINVTLKEEQQKLDEVVVTAIGIKQQKKKLGYTTQQVDNEALLESQTMNIGNALSGQIAGLTINNPTGIFQSPQISLRGKAPLIVLDGIPVETDFFDVNGDDIESINVLKGPTASALYGSRGKNGAILLVSKTAKKEGLEVSISTQNMVTAGFTVFPESQKEYGSGSNGKYEFWDGADGGISDGDMTWGPKLNTGAKIPQWNSPIRNKQTGEVIDWWGDVKGTVYDDKSLYERVPIGWVAHDNLEDFLRMGVVTNNNFSIAHHSAKARYYVSGKYAFQQGQVPNTSLTTGGLNFSSSFDITNSVQLDASLSYNNVYSPNYPRYGYGPKNHIYTILIWMSADVNGQELAKHFYVPGQEGYRQANYNYAWYNNPYFAAYELEQTKDVNVLSGKARLSWQILPNLSVQGRLALHQTKSYEDMKSPKSYMNYGDSRNGDFKIWNSGRQNLDADVLASYFRNLGSNINISANAGAAVFNRHAQSEYQSTDGLIVPALYSLSNTQGPVMASNSADEKEIRSVYGMANLDFYDAVFLNVTARNDWSSTLPASNRSYFYPSVALSTMVSEYLKLPKAVDYLKAYGSWAQVSSDLSPYSIYSTYGKGVTYGSTPSVGYPEVITNPNIMPEKSTSYEAGLSTAFLKNKLSLELVYYHILDENQIIDLNISEASGFSRRKVNGNEYATNGYEVVLGAQPVANKLLKWDISANWSRSIKRLTKIYGDQPTYNNLKVGDRADTYMASVWQKSADGQLILDANNLLPVKDPYAAKLGYLDPSWRLGLRNTFNIKNFKIDVSIDGAWGGLIRSLTVEKMWWGGKHPASVEYRDAEYAAGKPVYVPDGVIVTGGELSRDVEGNVISDTRAYRKNTNAVSWQTWCQTYPYQAQVLDSDDEKFANVFDRSFLKLRHLSVGYDLAKLADFGKIKSCELSLFGYNLLMWKKAPYVDPDYGNDDNLQDPSARYVGFSLNVKL